VYIFDTQSRTSTLVSVNVAGTSSGNQDSQSPVISPNGRWVAFQSKSGGLSTEPGLPPSFFTFALYARDIISNRTHIVSIGGLGVLADCSNAVFSADSRIIAFTVNSFNGIFVHDLFLLTNRIVCTNCTSPSLSGDGRLVAYETILNLNAQVRQVYLF